MSGCASRPSGATRANVERKARKNGASRWTWESRKMLGNTRVITIRFSSAYPMPDGAWLRSASTHGWPDPSRATSAAWSSKW